MATTITVSNATQLQNALSKAASGDTILLAPGNYGSLSISGKNFSSLVTIRSADPDKLATFTSVSVSKSSFIQFDSVHVDNNSNGGSASKVFGITASHDIIVVNSEINGLVDGNYTGHYGLYANDSKDITFADNYIHDINNGIVAFSVDGFVISGNVVDYVGTDFFKFGGINHALIENNTGGGHLYPLADAHADFMQFQGATSNTIIRGNVFLAQTSERAQGIFMGGSAGHTNVLIEENIIVSGKVNAIYVNDRSTGITVLDNTVLSIPNLGHKSALIIVPAGSVVQNNITSSTAGGFSGTNVIAQWDDPKDVNYYDKLFVNADKGLGITLEDLRPVDGSLAETKGAHDRLMSLLDGGATTAPEPISATTPEPLSAPEPVLAPEPAPAPAPEPTSGTTQGGTVTTAPDGVAYAQLGAHEFAASGDVIEIAHDPALALSSATIALTFNADTVAGSHGILSKDASGYGTAGGHFTSYIKDGTLYVRFQDSSSDKVFTVANIKANVDYDLQVSFGNGTVSVLLNGQSVGTAPFNYSWASNTEYLQIGANGWASAAGEKGFTAVFDGTISDVMIVAGQKTPAEMTSILQAETTSVQAPAPEPVAVTTTEPAPAPEPVVVSYAPTRPGPTLTTEPVPATSDTVVATEPAPATTAPATSLLAPVFSVMGDTEFNGKIASAINLAHPAELALDEGTIAFSFDADNVSKLQGLISKDAAGYDGGGNHFSAWVHKGQLVVRFEDDDSSAVFKVKGIKANVDYDVLAFFDEDHVGLYVDGKLIGVKDFTMDWTQNHENLQIGALGANFASGSSYASSPFDGTISDVMIFHDALTPMDYNFFS